MLSACARWVPARGRFFYRRSVLAEISVEDKLESRGSYTNRELIPTESKFEGYWLCMQHMHGREGQLRSDPAQK